MTKLSALRLRKDVFRLGAIAFMSLILLAFPQKPHAGTLCVFCAEVKSAHDSTQDTIDSLHEQTRDYITDQWEQHRNDFIIAFYFKHHILWAMMNMTEQLTIAGMHQMLAIGSMLDAKQQMETQALLQELTAEAHKRYKPDTDMCVFGTFTKSLAASQHDGQLVSFAIGEHLQDRQMQNRGTANGQNKVTERRGRLYQFKEHFCNRKDNNENLTLLCDGSSPPLRGMNADVNYTRTVSLPHTIEIDFKDGTIDTAGATDENAVFAMGKNLFTHDLIETLTIDQINANPGIALELKQYAAKHNVATSSYNAIVGMKARGAPQSEDLQKYAVRMMDGMGVDEDNVKALYGERPSYHAQMKLLTQTMYQRPEFYTGLYGSPANTERKGVTIDAIRLMQTMDMYKSQIRQEALLAIILETSLEEQYTDVRNRISGAVE